MYFMQSLKNWWKITKKYYVYTQEKKIYLKYDELYKNYIYENEKKKKYLSNKIPNHERRKNILFVYVIEKKIENAG